MCTELHNYYWWIKCWQFCPIIANHQSLLLTNISSYTVNLEVFEEQHLRGLVDLDISSKINILKNCQLRYHISFKISISSLYQACNQGGSRGSDEPPILTSFLLKPALCISTQQ